MRGNVSGFIISSGGYLLFGLAAVQQHNGLLHYAVSSCLQSTFRSNKTYTFIIHAGLRVMVFYPVVSLNCVISVYANSSVSVIKAI